MDDFLGIVVIIAVYLIAAASEGKKKKNQKRPRTRGFKTAFDAYEATGGQISATPERNASAGVQPSFLHEKDCKSSPIHLHDVPASAMEGAGEGEDPCHAGGLFADEFSRAEALERQDAEYDSAEENSAMQDVLRGVIMSEVLTRPCERMAMQRNRRRI